MIPLINSELQRLMEESAYFKLQIQINDKNEVEFTMIDNGTGIEFEDRDHVFEPKFTTKTSGMGLGLGIIKNIIENYKGTITFETELGKGTTFTVSLPLIEK